ncbi:uncharacterized protein TNCT_508731 [Trichonephila clavata]|uniref:Synaptic plasticity regulator PANTS n=1 Tax=Trichonephila clavata TaxID=2740835 RepID=A0A8X6L4L5_TRICU|nr:uncharacterized protein TNCT_508731 [Trichonephila clavata]
MSSNNRNEMFFEVSSEVEDSSNLPEDAWKVRPCEWYKEELKDCRSIKAKFNQYFIFGHTLDCSQWKQDYQNCMQFRKKRDLKCLENVIESENDRQRKRMKTMEQNDVWTYRTSPPENWNSPMPKWMQEDKKDSLLIKTQNMLNEGIDPTPIFTGISCIIQ